MNVRWKNLSEYRYLGSAAAWDDRVIFSDSGHPSVDSGNRPPFLLLGLTVDIEPASINT